VLRAISCCLKSPQAKAKVFEALLRYECSGEQPPDIGKWRNAKAVFTCCVEIMALHEKIAQSQKDNKRKAGIMSGEARQKKEANEGEEIVVSSDVTTYEQNPTETNRNFEPATHTNNNGIYNTCNNIIENTRAQVDEVIEAEARDYLSSKLIELEIKDPPETPETYQISNIIWKWCDYTTSKKKSCVTTYLVESVIMSLLRWYGKDTDLWKASIFYHIQSDKPALYYQDKSKLVQNGKQGSNSGSNYYDKQRAESDDAMRNTAENIARLSGCIVGGPESAGSPNNTADTCALCDGS